MSYSNQLVEYLMQANQTAFSGSVGTDLCWYAPGYQPVQVRAAFCIVGTVLVSSPSVQFTTQVTAFSNVGITAGDIAILKLGTTAAGKVIYKDAINDKKVSPGQSVVANILVAEATGKALFGLTVEPSWETPANNTSLVVTA